MTDKDTEATPTGTKDAQNTSQRKLRKRFLLTLPRILTGIAAVVTAVGGLITVLSTTNILGPSPTATTPPLTPAPAEATSAPGESVGLKVVATTPENGAKGVDPALDEIVVVFSAPVKQNRWSFVVVEGAALPQVTGDPYFLDPTTCVLPVQLEGGKSYSIGVNSPTHQGFVSALDESRAAEPFVLVFSTTN